MSTHGPILVALDGSEQAEKVLGPAEALANAFRTHMSLLTVLEDSSGVAPATETELERLGRDYFNSYLQDVRTRLGRPEIRTMVRVGNPADEILSCVDEIDAGVIAVATHGRSGVGRWMYGSTASDILNRSTVPVVVIGPHNRAAASPSAFSRIMVPLDGSRLAEGAIGTARELRDATGARILLVRVVPWAIQAFPYALPSQYVPELDKELVLGGEEYLRGQRTALGDSAAVHILRGNTADELIDFVDREHVDLVVMSTHGRGGLSRVALGSTADRVIQCSAPVLLMPSRSRVVSRADPAAPATAAGH